eukprot:829118-Rhodomonas_salina.2
MEGGRAQERDEWQMERVLLRRVLRHRSAPHPACAPQAACGADCRVVHSAPLPAHASFNRLLDGGQPLSYKR